MLCLIFLVWHISSCGIESRTKWFYLMACKSLASICVHWFDEDGGGILVNELLFLLLPLCRASCCFDIYKGYGCM